MDVASRDRGDVVWLDREDYAHLRRAAATYRKELVVRLGAEASLQPSEMTRITPGDLSKYDYDGTTHTFLSVPGGSDGGREVYLRADIERDLRRYVRSNDVAPDERVIDVTPRRVQMLVAAVAERAAAETGNTDFERVSSDDLRRYFARTLLVEEGVNPMVVMSVGGWERLASLRQYFETPTRDEVVEELARRHPTAVVDNGRPADAGVPDAGAGDDRVEAVVRAADAVVDALGDASTREAIERVACERLAADAYEFAWVGEVATDRLAPSAWAGVDESALRSHASDGGGVTPEDVDRAVRSGDVVVSWDVRTAPEPGGAEHRSLAVVPLTHGESSYGALVVCSDRPEAFGETEQTLLATLGRQVAAAVAVVEWQRLVLADAVVELEFRITDRRSFLVDASADLGCRFGLGGVVPAEEGALLYFVTMTGASPGDLIERAADATAVDDVRLVRNFEDRSLLEVVLTGASPAVTLVESGGSVRELVVEDGEERVTAEFAPDVDVRTVVDAVGRAFPASDLVAKREIERPVETSVGFRRALEDRLTERQLSVLRAAYLAGYFEWPRGSTAEELADSMGVSSPTLHNHLRKAQQKLLTAFFDGDVG